MNVDSYWPIKEINIERRVIKLSNITCKKLFQDISGQVFGIVKMLSKCILAEFGIDKMLSQCIKAEFGINKLLSNW